MRWVSLSVLNEFMRMKGTLTLCTSFRCSICRTERSKKVIPSRTSIADLGAPPLQKRIGMISHRRPPIILSTGLHAHACPQPTIKFENGDLCIVYLLVKKSRRHNHIRKSERTVVPFLRSTRLAALEAFGMRRPVRGMASGPCPIP